MSTIATAHTSPTSTSTSTTTTAKGTPSWRFGLATGVLASAATMALVVVLRAAGVPLDVQSEPIPVVAFAQMVLLGTVIGIVLARRVRPSTFIRATVVLTAASCIPSVALGTGVASKLGLVLTHVVAAAIVVPALASRQRS